ncbi:uncharacterized protein N7473_007965 [Penicillium subrubescens]|uniref:uncharacterized protein n=1 Tax=Penicillium subrubescens TaxID=1316194 RepID=UPI002544E8A6|nr:uncharacterized protein N7473_007965 [Penicillium subrubescens]KAJ5891737.1 hypothetical protein N7473_007965 [Penicillium subrubescens]
MATGVAWDMGWRRDGENLRKAQKRFVWAAVTGAESRELGSERARRAWQLCQQMHFLHQTSIWSQLSLASKS